MHSIGIYLGIVSNIILESKYNFHVGTYMNLVTMADFKIMHPISAQMHIDKLNKVYR